MNKIIEKIKSSISTFFRGEDGSFFWLIKTIIAGFKVLAEAANSQFKSAAKSLQKDSGDK